MPRKKKSDVSPTQTAAVPQIPEELLDRLITGPITQDQFQSIYGALKKAIFERAMGAEMTAHLGYKRGEPSPISATARAARRCSLTKAPWTSRCRVIAKAPMSRC